MDSLPAEPPGIRLISTSQQVEECLHNRANCISQPVDLRLLSPAISAYTAARHEVRQGAQGASHVAPGKSGLHVRGEGALAFCRGP